MRNYQKLTVITAILGSIIPFIGIFIYFFINSLIGVPILGLIFGSALIVGIVILGVNIGAIISVFKLKNTKLVGLILFACGGILFAVINLFAIPGLVLFVISGIYALRYKGNGINKIKL